MNFWLLWSLYFVYLLSGQIWAYDAVPRWGQATVVVNDALFVHGGKTDKYDSYSYTSAPNTDDLIYLSLSSSFEGSSPPWELVGSFASSLPLQGHALAWHTLSAFNTSTVLLFGGQPGPNSPTVTFDSPDSAFLLDVHDRLEPHWISEAASWAGQPSRRIRQATATTTSGLVVIIGGEKADGSNNGFSDHHVFDPNVPSFTRLPTNNGPPDIYGHASVIMPDGRLLVFGGYSQSQGTLLAFSTIWALDTTQTSLSWATLDISNSSLPTPRRAFAAVLLIDGKILIHGGSDAVLQNNYDDGWILDTSQHPMLWTQVGALSQLGARRDHFAISVGTQVIFGLGYGNSSPASASLQIYDASRGIFITTFTPSPSTMPTQTLPGPSKPSGTIGIHSGTGTRSGAHPTATGDPNSGNPNSGGSDGGPQDEKSSKNKKTTAIALGTTFGVLSLLVVGATAAYYIRRRQRQSTAESSFLALGAGWEGDGRDSPHLEGRIPAAISPEEEPTSGNHGWNLGVLTTLRLAGVVGAVAGSRNARNFPQRRDMLADEDTREFGGWYDARRRDGTSSSSWSLKSILATRTQNREPSTVSTSAGSTWREKTDPFSDGAPLITNEETGYVGAAALGPRLRVRREMSYTTIHSSMSFIDPFADPIQEEVREEVDTSFIQTQHSIRTHNPLQPLPLLQTTLPLSVQAHTLSPLSERASQNTLSQHDSSTPISSNTYSNEHLSPFEHSPSRVTSHTSFEHSRSPGSIGTSIIGTAKPPSQPIRRSDSWWTRFARTSLLDRKASDASRRSSGMPEIRDPNPPPRLIAIEESMNSGSFEQDSPNSLPSNSNGLEHSVSRKGSGLYGGHGKSMSSLRTADTEAIERMGGTMVVAERVRAGSHGTTDSISTTESVMIDTRPESLGQDHTDATAYGELVMFASPVEMSHDGSLAYHADVPHSPIMSPSPTAAPDRPPTSLTNNGRQHVLGTVVARVQAYERRMSQDQEVPSLTNTKQREERPRQKSRGISVNYGLVPRPSLYIANPDHRAVLSEKSR